MADLYSTLNRLLMFVIYGLLLVAMIYGVIILLVRQKKRGTPAAGKSLKNTPGVAGTNEGGNSQRAENDTGGSSGQSDHNSMGADNDEDVTGPAANAQRRRDFDQYGA